VLEVYLQAVPQLSSTATWFASFCAAAVTVLVVYVGIVLLAVLHASDREERQLLYEIFRDLLDLFRPGTRK
jgi:hypothetical protein